MAAENEESVLLGSASLLASQGSVDQLAALLRAVVTEPLGLVRALASVGSVDRAVELVETALTLGLPSDLTDRLRCLLVELRLAGGEVDPALDLAERILGEHSGAPSSVHAAVAAGRVFGRYARNAEEGRRHAETVLREHDGRIAGDAEVLAAATVLSDAVLSDGRVVEGLRLARAAVASAPDMPSPVWRAHLHLVLAERLVDAGAAEEAERAVAAARESVGRTSGGGADMAFAHLRARLLSHQGRLAEARDEAQKALSAAVGRGARIHVPPLLAALGQFALRFGDVEGAAGFVRRCRKALGELGGHLPSSAYDWVALQVASARCGDRAALERMTRDYAAANRRVALFARRPGAAAWFVRTALAAGDPHWAAVAARTAARLAERNPGVPTLAAAALHADSLLRGDPDGLVRAATEHRHHWARTTAAEDLTALLDARSRRPAPTAKDEAGTGTPAEALSDVERRVARLVGEGLTNQQVALRLRRSPHTVNYHLRNIFRKLDIGSRVELARQAHLWTAAR
ncbi:helix-turn-helix domain-containing protein [Streptomyces tropicalis]|uniref:Helix-turn-helix transcriptional regulator n=1 Tax=Streptomyces tropicalis TaxID=3034234 RepID=A0ABT6ABT5_9ACTN|nr:helix-turn-helix transcriptional regulator [Streptomyces tropicalis]MDF3302114.1 helix-turn-helix transcriptional regulator [Streptomyces tropicalis]